MLLTHEVCWLTMLLGVSLSGDHCPPVSDFYTHIPLPLIFAPETEDNGRANKHLRSGTIVLGKKLHSPLVNFCPNTFSSVFNKELLDLFQKLPESLLKYEKQERKCHCWCMCPVIWSWDIVLSSTKLMLKNYIFDLQKLYRTLTMLHKFIILNFIILYFRTYLNSPCLLAGGWACLVMNLYPTIVNSHKKNCLIIIDNSEILYTR